MITADGGYRRGARRPAQGQRRRGARETTPDRRERAGRPARRLDAPASRHASGPRRLVARRAEPTPSSASARPSRWTASTRSTSSTPAARPASPRASLHTTGGYLLGATLTTQVGLRPARTTTSTGAPPTSAGSPATATSSTARSPNGATMRDVRGRARLSRPGPLLGDRREVRRHDPLHRADGDPRLHAAGATSARRSTICQSLRLLGTVGEPINPEAWIWYHEHIGGGRCPIVDTWWQTETGDDPDHAAARASPTLKPGSATLPFPGIDAEVVDEQRRRRCRRSTAATSSSRSPGRHAAHDLGRSRALRPEVLEPRSPACYFTGDGAAATRTATSGSWAASTTCSTSPATASARWRSRARWSATQRWPRPRSIGIAHEIKGQAIVAFVTLDGGHHAAIGDLRRRAARARRRRRSAPIAQPDDICFTAELPKTRSRQDHAPPAAGHRRGASPRRHDDADRPGGPLRAFAASTRSARASGAD